MDGRIPRSFPGGPTREGSSEGRERATRLHRVGDVEARKASRSLAGKRRRRRRRAVIGIVVSVLVSGGVGVALGLHNRTTAEDFIAEQEEAARPRDVDITREVNRTLLELWRMEEAEVLRRSPR